MIIITGADGFIGSNLVTHLSKNLPEESLTLVVSLASDSKWKNLRQKRFNAIINKDRFLESIIKNELPELPIAIVHLGASSYTTEMDCGYLLENNYEYTRILAEYSLKNSVKFIYASSAATYGNGELGFSDEDSLTPNLLPTNPYGFSKWLFDQWAIRSTDCKTLVGLRFFNVYGPNEHHKGGQSSPVPIFYKQLKETGKVRLFQSEHPDYKDGEQKRDFIWVDDCCSVIRYFIKRRNDVPGGIFNVGTGHASTWLHMAKAIHKAGNFAKDFDVEYIPMPEKLKEHYQYFTEADLSKLLGSAYYPDSFTPLDVGVSEYVTKYLDLDRHR
jgi:ADP-L-glycero-D-manno-heptose 6-epimerase